MSNSPEESDLSSALLVSEVCIQTYIDEEGQVIDCFKAVNANGDKLDLKSILGTLRLAEDTAFSYCAEDDED